jgi:hypothetical protein
MVKLVPLTPADLERLAQAGCINPAEVAALGDEEDSYIDHENVDTDTQGEK